MILKPTKTLMAIILLTIMQSCTVPNPYEPIANTPNTSTTSANNTDNENDEDEDEDGTTGTTTGSTTAGGTTTGTATTAGIILSGNSSASGANKSHNVGQNCMNCHNPGGSGSGKGIWQLSGTVYNQAGTATIPNTVVKFYTGPNGTGTLKYTLNADSKGNLYSVGPVDFTGGLYPAVTGSTTTKYMGSSISSGSCNSCHNGSATARIWAQ